LRINVVKTCGAEQGDRWALDAVAHGKGTLVISLC